MTNLSAEALRELKDLAAAATPGPYQLFEVGDISSLCVADKDKTSLLTIAEEDGTAFAAFYSDDDAKYLAAASPDVILALLAERERLLDALKEFVNLNVDIVCAKAADKRKIEALHDKAMAALAAAGEE